MAQRPRSWVFEHPDADIPLYTDGLNARYLPDEADTLRELVAIAKLEAKDAQAVTRSARELVKKLRANRRKLGGLDAFMGEYDLSSHEGVVLMCLAEALLRIPDAEVADSLIADKLADADFEWHLGQSHSVFVNATTWALMLTGKLVMPETLDREGVRPLLARMINRLGEPVLRTAMRQAMRIMAHQFVMGRTIEEAIERAAGKEESRYRHSFDMLGEAALTAEAAATYMDAYTSAIAALALSLEAPGELMSRPGISVKLSALCPRFEHAQTRRAVAELVERVGVLARNSRDAGISLTIDAEEADRLELTLEVFREVLLNDWLRDWPGIGIAVQSYQRRALSVIDWLESLAATIGRSIPVRLVKGAYWDTEIKRAQIEGLEDYPVFTRKLATDVSYLACARRLLEGTPHLFPQFATHNAQTIAWVAHVGADREFEFQRLHGMGEELYSEIVSDSDSPRPCRVYAPVGSHEDLLPYLVRRLLENGANTSFVNRIAHEEASIDELVGDPVASGAALGEHIRHPRIPLPRDLFGAERRNSAGLNLADSAESLPLAEALAKAAAEPADARPLINGEPQRGERVESLDPSETNRRVGEATYADAGMAQAALDAASAYQEHWKAVPVSERAAALRAAAERLEAHRAEIVALCVADGGRSIPDSLSEVREAVDFLRYYAIEAERLLGEPATLPGPTGESNSLRLMGRGPFLCISPWNFPCAIFTGQIAAALAAGNTVIAKPAEATPLVASRIVGLLHDAGIPAEALQFLPGHGPIIGSALLPDPRLAGVAFTGSVVTAQLIARQLAAREGPQAVLIAETGGINAMIVDSSALTEQVVRDAVHSAFNSAGQRCSALRLLCLQEETADAVIEMLKGAMAELTIGDPALLKTDVGPVIDDEAQVALTEYVSRRRERFIYQCPLDDALGKGTYFPPTLIELDAVTDLTEEVFGPVLHVVRYAHKDIDALVDDLNAVGYGLTLGIQSRVGAFAERIAARARVGNVYVNRNMIGAVVGVQPFGGMGLSGTGPKAGGPHYLARFLTEQTVTINTAAVGGNATLLTLADDS